MTEQLALGVKLQNDTTFENFFVGDNAATVSALESFAKKQGEHFIYLCGPKSSGRSHLLQACCQQQEPTSAFYLSLSEKGLEPCVLSELEQVPLVCLDDVDFVLGKRLWEEALLHFYNESRANGHRLVVSSDVLPQQTQCILMDVRSRLQWGLTLQLRLLNDEQKIKALQLRAEERGLFLDNEVAQYLLRHTSRDMSLLMDCLAKLDDASLAEKRRLTIPFVRHVLTVV